MMQSAGLDKTPQGRQTIAALMALSSAGSRLPDAAKASFATAASQPNPQDELAAVQQFTTDPQVAKLVQEIQGGKPGVFPSDVRSQRQAASRRALDAQIASYASAKGIDAQKLRDQIESQLVGTEKRDPVSGAIAGTLGLDDLAKLLP